MSNKTVILDIETDGLVNPKNIWCIVTKDIDTNAVQVFDGEDMLTRFQVFADTITKAIGHNIISFDQPVLEAHGIKFNCDWFDTLVVSRLLNVGRSGGHSLENWGTILGFPKGDHNEYDKYSPEMLEYCKNDVELTHKVFTFQDNILKRNKGSFDAAISIEHDTQRICNDMHRNGFKFNISAARELRAHIQSRVDALDTVIHDAYPPRLVRTQLKTKVREDWITFNPASPKQLVDVLWEAGWKPVDRTVGHAKKVKNREKLDDKTKRYGWKVSEANLQTLPETAPEACKVLVERLLCNGRLRTLDEWEAEYNEQTGRIHGTIVPLGARTHRATHQSPNMGNVPTKKSIKYNAPKLRELALDYGAKMRSMWECDADSWLVGCDMESAHLRIFAHLIDDAGFIQALISGKKEDGTDPHSLNKRALGDVCLDRDRAKTFIFSYLNGAAASKVSDIFGCSAKEAKECLDKFVKAYPGLAKLKKETIPNDASRGYFIGTDGRKIICDSEHHMIGMYLQSTEAILMKYANRMWRQRLDALGIKYRQVNWVHDEWVTEITGSDGLARSVGEIQSQSIRDVGETFGLRCPMGGEYKIGKNWLDVH